MPISSPVPAILEYLPYRKRDGTYERDAMTHPYLAGHGYAGVRVDIRGSGESGGLLFDEYTKQEQDDALEVIAWLAAQPWCSGAVGMMGISWGGFNALQVAARRPPALKAIVTTLLDGRPVSRRRALYGRRAADRGARLGFVLLYRDVSSARPCAGRRSLALDVAAAPRECAALPGNVAAPPAARRLLAVGVGVRGLRRDPMPGIRGRRLDRRLQERNPASARAS